MDDSFDLITLSLLPHVGPRGLRKLRERGPLSGALSTPRDHPDVFGSKALQQLGSGEARTRAEAELRRARQQGARLVACCDPSYPTALLQIYDPPVVLYVRGALDPDDGERSVAVVGSRAATPQGTTLARAIASDLASFGLIIVSGLARGIDSAAHQGALDAGGRTVAVLGSGLDRMYPAENAELARSIERDGVVVSEFPFGTAPNAANFPRRNRIIAGWSRAVLVVEAAERSGALSTARQALDEGREVLAVPGHPTQAGAAGTNALIRDGAVLVRHARDVAEALGLEVPASASTAEPAQGLLAQVPRESPVTVDELHRRSGQPMEHVLAELTRLELSDRVRRLPGALYVRN